MCTSGRAHVVDLKAELEWNSELSTVSTSLSCQGFAATLRYCHKPLERGGGLLGVPFCWPESELNSLTAEEGGGCKTHRGEKRICLSPSDVESPGGSASTPTGNLPGTLPD